MSLRKSGFAALLACLLLAGIVGNVALAKTCSWDGWEMDITDCVWDSGCWANPYEPDYQWWTYHYHHYVCDDGTSEWRLISRWEDGPCCTP